MTIKEAAKKLHVEAHVLRYWEDELKLDIKRNAQGHRYYDDRDIRLFESVKAMKEEGLFWSDLNNYENSLLFQNLFYHRDCSGSVYLY